jgi:Tfp pilus assembly pilus retraction ATPase PilT
MLTLFLQVLMRPDQYDRLVKREEVDFSYENSQSVRFRGNAFFQRGKKAIALCALFPMSFELSKISIYHQFLIVLLKEIKVSFCVLVRLGKVSPPLWLL